jgi:hypothetical protein
MDAEVGKYCTLFYTATGMGAYVSAFLCQSFIAGQLRSPDDSGTPGT